MEMDSRKLVADNGQIEFAEASGIGDHKTPNEIAEVPLTAIAVEAFKDQLTIAGPGPLTETRAGTR